MPTLTAQQAYRSLRSEARLLYRQAQEPDPDARLTMTRYLDLRDALREMEATRKPLTCHLRWIDMGGGRV